MVKESLNSQILKRVILIITVSSCLFYFFTYSKIKNKIDEDQFLFYNKNIQTKMFLLEEKYNRLRDTGLIESYEKSFQEGILVLLRKMFYGKDLNIRPYIIDAKKGAFLLHPIYNTKNKKEYENNEILEKSIQIRDGEFNLEDEKEQKWIIVQTFKQWDWIIGYSVPFDVKYYSLYTFQSNFIFMIIFLLLIVPLIVWVSIRKLLSPINQLIIESKKIKDGNLDSTISIKASYELSELSNNFISMRDSVKNNINELNNTKKLLQNIIDNAPIRIFWKDKKGKFLGANKLFLEDFGNIKIKNLIGKTDIDFNIKEAEQYMKDDLEIMSKNITKLNFIETQTFDNQNELIISTSKVPLLNFNREVMGILGVYNDITEQVKLQNELKEKEILIVQQSKMAAMGEMLGNIAHQWRQPLSAISTASTGAKLQKEMDCLSDSQLNSALTAINESAQYLSTTIDDFRDFFNPSNNKISEFLISNTIEKTLNIVSAQFVAKDIEIITNIEDTSISSLENELIQVLVNILNNARDVLVTLENRKKYIFIKIYKKESNLFIDIKDNAGGIPENIIDKIFQPYFTTKHQSQGTGIGLYMSEEIVKNHLGGSLTVSNETYTYQDIEYTGAKFTIQIT